MRHSFATRCHDAGMDATLVQMIMGHAKIETTLDIYTHISNEQLKKGISILKDVVIF